MAFKFKSDVKPISFFIHNVTVHSAFIIKKAISIRDATWNKGSIKIRSYSPLFLFFVLPITPTTIIFYRRRLSVTHYKEVWNARRLVQIQKEHYCPFHSAMPKVR